MVEGQEALFEYSFRLRDCRLYPVVDTGRLDGPAHSPDQRKRGLAILAADATNEESGVRVVNFDLVARRTDRQCKIDSHQGQEPAQ